MTPTTEVHATIAGFARAVRSALDDLPPEEVDELTDGLEADLIEQASDGEPEAFDPGDPFDYAQELRASAGLPARDAGRRSPPRESIGERLRRWRAGWSAGIRRRPGGSAILDFLIVLRPVWWVLRGWIASQILSMILGLGGPELIPLDNLAMTIVFVLCVILSVQWGRGRWLPWALLRVARTVVSIGVLVALIPVVLATTSQSISYGAPMPYEDPYSGIGLNQDGNPIENIFVFDADGNPIENAQLFDQNGDPLYAVPDPLNQSYTTSYDQATGEEHVLVPNRDVPGGNGWNIYPLEQVDVDRLNAAPDWDAATRTLPAVPVPAPFATVRPLAAEPGKDGTSSGSPEDAKSGTSGTGKEGAAKPVRKAPATKAPPAGD